MTLSPCPVAVNARRRRLDRRRAHYARLQQWLLVYLRFAVGTIMIGYGLAKVFHTQFPAPTPAKLEQPYGDASPMGLLWTFMGFSGPYNVFTGLAETVPALMLFFRRTATLGALLLVAVMTNVVVLNFCYDVPVKIFSTQLLLASLYIAGPRLVALFDVLIAGRAVAAHAPPPLFARRRLELAARSGGAARLLERARDLVGVALDDRLVRPFDHHARLGLGARVAHEHAAVAAELLLDLGDRAPSPSAARRAASSP